MLTYHCHHCGAGSPGLRLCAPCGRRLTREQVAEFLKQVVVGLAARAEAEGAAREAPGWSEAHRGLLLPGGRN